MSYEYDIYDIFADASIHLPTKTACAGCLVVNRTTGQKYDQYFVQLNGTNNSAEIMALWMAVCAAANIRNTSTKPTAFNIFSDSKISLFGLREWMPSWVQNMDVAGNLVNTSGVVKNQEWYRDVFNIIYTNRLKVSLYHQKGHVSIHSSKSLLESERLFYNSNGVRPVDVGLSVTQLAMMNDHVDRGSRQIAFNISHGADIKCFENACYARHIPMWFDIHPDMLPVYLECLRGGFNSYN